MADDRNIEIGVKLDTRNAQENAKHLQKEIENIFKATGGKQLDSKMQSLEASMSKVYNSTEAVKEKIDELSQQEIPTEAFQKVSDKLDELEPQLEQVTKDYERLQNTPGVPSSVIEQKAAEMQRLETEISKAQAEMGKLVDEGKAFTPGTDANAEKIATLERQLLSLNNQQTVNINKAYEYDEALKDEVAEMNNLSTSSGQVVGVFQSVANGFRTLYEGAQEADVGLGALVSNIPYVGSQLSVVGTVVGAAIGGLVSLGKAAGSIAVSGVKKLASSLANLAKAGIIKGINLVTNSIKKLGVSLISTRGHSKKLGTSFLTMVKAMLGVRGLYMLFRKLRSALVDGMKSVAQFNDGNNEVNQSISMLMSSLTQLKNAFAAAFAPILNIVAPVLNQLIQMLITAANAIGMFFAKLGGKSTVIQATKVNQNYAKSLDSTSSSAKKANEQLAEYDELKVIQSQDDTSGGGSGGLDPNSMFKEVPIDSTISDLVDKLKEAWEKADFYGIGRIVGEKVKEALDTANEWLVNVAKPFANRLGTSIATFLNGFFSTPGLATSLGTAIGNMLNVALEFAYAFISKFNFTSFGKFVGEGLTAAITTFDWKKAGLTAALALNGLFSALNGFAQTFDGKAVANSISGGINNAIAHINWSSNASYLAKFVNSLWSTLNTLIGGVDWKSLGKGITTSIQTFFKEVDWSNAGQTLTVLWTSLCDFLAGLIEGVDWKSLPQDIIDAIIEFFSGVDWSDMGDSFWTLFWTAIKAAMDLLKGIGEVFKNFFTDIGKYFEEHISEAEDAGGSIWDGIAKGITDALGSVGQWIYDNIFTPFITGFKNAFGIHSPSTVMEEQAGFIVDGFLGPLADLPTKVLEIFTQIKDDIVGKVTAAADKVKEKFGEAKDKIVETCSTAATNAKEKFEEIKTNVAEKASTVAADVKEHFGTVKTDVTESVKEAKKKATSAFSTIKDKLSSYTDSVKTKVSNNFSTLKKNIKESVSEMKKNSKEKFADIKKNASDSIKTMRDNVSKYFQQTWTKIKSPINSMLAGIEKFANGVISAINKMIDGLNQLSWSIPDWVPVLGGSSFGFNFSHVPTVSIPRLAQGAVIPPNNEFLAILGDQKSGTNIEAPLDTIVQAFEQVLSENSNNNQSIVLQLNGRDIAQAVWDENDKRYKQTGFRPSYA